MTARAVPTMPSFLAGQKLTATLLNQIGNYGTFWADPPMFRMYQTVAQSIANSTDTQITLDTPDYDTDSGRSGSTPYNYVVPVGMSGRWTLTWAVAWTINATGARDSYLKVNGSRIGAPESAEGPASNDFTQLFGSVTVKLNAGDSVALWVWQNSGGSVSTAVAGPSVSVFEGHLISLANP